MKHFGKTAVLLLALAIGLVQYASAKPLIGLKKPTVTYERVEVKKVTFEKADVEFVFTVDNPNPIGLDYILLDYELLLKGKSAASGKDMKFQIKSKSKSELRLPSEIDFIRLFTSAELLTKAVLSGEKSIPFTLNTDFKADLKLLKFNIPGKTDGELPLPVVKGKLL